MSVVRSISAILLTAILVGCSDHPVVEGTNDRPLPAIRHGLWVQPGEGRAPRVTYVRAGKYGYLDDAGRVAIEPKYEWANDFRGGFALCTWNEQGTIIGEAGEIIGRVPDSSATSYFRADVDRVWYQVDKKWGLCNLQGEVIVKPTYDDVDAFSDSLARVNIGAKLEFPGIMEGGKTGYINHEGVLVIDCTFDEMGWDFAEGYARVGKNLINREGQIQFSRFGLGFIVSNGLINVRSFKDDATTDYVDTAGNVEFTVDGYGEAFSEGFAVVSNNGRAGFIDETGEFVIQPQFEKAHAFSNGLAGVSVGEGRWGYIDADGTLVTPSHFNEVKPAEREYAIVHYGGTEQTAEDGPSWWEGGRWLMIDRSGLPLAVTREDKGVW